MKQTFEIGEKVFDYDDYINRKIEDIIQNGQHLTKVEIDQYDPDTLFHTSVVKDELSDDWDLVYKVDRVVEGRYMQKYAKDKTFHGHPVCFEHERILDGYQYFCPSEEQCLFEIELDQI